jgi:hypothetical protein
MAMDALSMAGSISGTAMPPAAPAAAIIALSSSGLIFSIMSAAISIILGSSFEGSMPGGKPPIAPAWGATAAGATAPLAPLAPLAPRPLVDAAAGAAAPLLPLPPPIAAAATLCIRAMSSGDW